MMAMPSISQSIPSFARLKTIGTPFPICMTISWEKTTPTAASPDQPAVWAPHRIWCIATLSH
jgi:hypothetical protein